MSLKYRYLEILTHNEKKAGKETMIALMLDEISIHKQLTWTGSEYFGCVDLGDGGGLSDDVEELAGNALVFMAVSTNSRWKLQLGYFLINGLSGVKRANLVKMCKKKIRNIGITIVSVTCDGPAVNSSMFKALGASVDANSILDTKLENEPETKDPDFAIYDICHMEKLVRNAWASLGIIKNLQGQDINWDFIVRLYNLQCNEKLHLCNKLTLEHINWKSQKMKTTLAVQTMSHRNAAAIDFARDVLKLPQFQNSQATTEFMRFIDRTFDLLNSKSKFGLGYKKPLTKENKEEWTNIFLNSTQYLSSLTNIEGKSLITTQKRVGFLGFIVGMQSFCSNI